jgi:hypothetical protein
MKHLQNDSVRFNKTLKQKGIKPFNTVTVVGLFAITFLLSSCEAIAGIFKAGMGFGIFIVVAIIAVIVFIAMKAGKKNT